MSSLKYKNKPVRGFTLIEILVVIGMLAILSTVVLVAINPLRQFAQARQSQRQTNVAAILNAVGHRIADNRGIFAPSDDPCALPTQPATEISSATYDLRNCLVPTYIAEIPVDPSIGFNNCKSRNCPELYSSEYTIYQPEEGGRITVCAPVVEGALGGEQFCLTR